MILKWRILSATNDLDRVSAVALPKLPISLTNTDLKVANDTKFFPGLGKKFFLLGKVVFFLTMWLLPEISPPELWLK